MRNYLFTLLLCITFGHHLPVYCQQPADTSFRQKAIENLINFYRTSTGLQAHLYNGPQYEPYTKPLNSGHPFFISDSIQKGWVSYDGLEYPDVPMRYDLIRDELLILYPSGFPVSLIKQKTDSFAISGQRFIKLTNIGYSASGDSAAYYHQLYSSPSISLLAKRIKNVQEMSGRSEIERTVFSKNFYYIRKNGVFHPVRNKKLLLDILKDRKTETQQFIKKNKLRFKQFEKDVLQTIAYYDQLK